MLPPFCSRSSRAARAGALLLTLSAACSIDTPDYLDQPGVAGGAAEMGAGSLQGSAGRAVDDPDDGSSDLPVTPTPTDPQPTAEQPIVPGPTPAMPTPTPAMMAPQREGSAATSLLTVSAEQVLEGDSVMVQLVVNDAAGQPLGRGGDIVTFTVSGGDAQGTFGPVQDRGNGTYSASFTGTLAGTQLSVGATLDGTAISSTLPSLRVLRYSNLALSFNGTSQYLSLGDLLMATGSFSLWLNTAKTDAYVLSKLVAGESVPGEVRLFLEAGRVVFRIEGTPLNEARSTASVADSRWHHVLVSFNPGLALYVDGQLQGTPNTTTEGGLLASGPTMEIGRNNATTEDHFSGLLDEIAFFNRPLTAAEVLAVYGSGSPGNLQSSIVGGNLLNWWHLGEFDTPPVLQDSVGQRSLTMVGMSAANVVPVER